MGHLPAHGPAHWKAQGPGPALHSELLAEASVLPSVFSWVHCSEILKDSFPRS